MDKETISVKVENIYWIKGSGYVVIGTIMVGTLHPWQNIILSDSDDNSYDITVASFYGKKGCDIIFEPKSSIALKINGISKGENNRLPQQNCILKG